MRGGSAERTIALPRELIAYQSSVTVTAIREAIAN
jgi:hypothetical protein